MNIVELIVIFAVWSTANNNNPTTGLIVILVIIGILFIQSLSVNLGLVVSRLTLAYDKQFLAIRRSLLDNQAAEMEETIKDIEPSVAQSTIKIYINSFGIGICYFAALIMLYVSVTSL